MLKFTRMCKYWSAGNGCHLGDKCSFAHGYHQLKQRPDMLFTGFCTKFRRKGYCKNGEACTFAHSQSELRRRPNNQQAGSSTPNDSHMQFSLPADFPYLMRPQPGMDYTQADAGISPHGFAMSTAVGPIGHGVFAAALAEGFLAQS